MRPSNGARRVRAGLEYLSSALQGRVLQIKFPVLKPSFRVESHLTIAERVALYQLACRARYVMEVGSYMGASACCFGAALKRGGEGKVICVDTWNNDAMSEGHRDTWAAFLGNTAEYKNFIFPIKGFSVDVVEAVREIAPRVDLLFIDGDHSYDAVRADWCAYRSFLDLGSVVAFHDYGWAEGVRKVVQEDVMPWTGNYNALPNMWWGTVTKLS
jgi:cephalosporin hydroxylase